MLLFRSTTRYVSVFGFAMALAVLVVAGQQSLAAKTVLEYNRSESQAAVANGPSLQIDQKVQAASHVEPPTPQPAELSGEDLRVLAPPSQSSPRKSFGEVAKNSLTAGLPTKSLTTAGMGLAIVLGLFMICMWLMQRSGPKPNSPLPAEAIAVLGKMPLANRNVAQLLQVGNKLVLVAITADGITPITEVTDPNEVTRLLGICLRHQKQSSSAEFQQVLQKLSQEQAEGFLGKEATSTYSQVSR